MTRWLMLAIACAGCRVEPIEFTPAMADAQVEDCATPGDEDGDDTADCDDADCASEPSCQPTCSDRTHNGDETDVDCGGSCPACLVGRCAIQADCAAPGVCDAEACRLARSCLELLQQHPTTVDGAYTIEPVGATSFDVVCDMTRDGGGWTLLLKSVGDLTLANAASAWIDDTLIAPDDLTTQPANAKYRSFLAVPVSTLRGELDGFLYTQEVGPGSTALAVFQGEPATVDFFPTFNTGAPNWSAQPNCNTFGINIPHTARARFGWSANQEDNCITNDTAIGLGINGRGAGYVCGSSQCSAGNVDAGGTGLLWGR